MNIFRLDDSPIKSAIMAMDVHVVKMSCETSQLLHTALHVYGLREKWMYKPFNPKHPSCKWIIESRENFKWLGLHGIALCGEYTRRYKKIHKCLEKIDKALSYAHLIPDKPETPQLLAMPDQFRSDDPVHSYRLYYAGAKAHMNRSGWKFDGPPSWWDEYRSLVKSKGLEIANDKNDGVKV